MWPVRVAMLFYLWRITTNKPGCYGDVGSRQVPGSVRVGLRHSILVWITWHEVKMTSAWYPKTQHSLPDIQWLNSFVKMFITRIMMWYWTLVASSPLCFTSLFSHSCWLHPWHPHQGATRIMNDFNQFGWINSHSEEASDRAKLCELFFGSIDGNDQVNIDLN